MVEDDEVVGRSNNSGQKLDKSKKLQNYQNFLKSQKSKNLQNSAKFRKSNY